MYKLFIFDMDGTIIDSDLMIIFSWVEVYKKFKPDYKPRMKDLVSFSGPPLSESIPKAFPEFDPHVIEDYYLKVCPKYYESTIVAMPCIKDVLDKIRKDGGLTAVNTNKRNSFAKYTLNLLGMENRFDYMAAGGDVEKPKPSPLGVYKIMEEAGVKDPHDVLYIGDGVYDFMTAENAHVDMMMANLRGLLVPSEVKPRYYLESYEDFFEVLEHGK
jgi:phosphoglycolate phosphatase-like HAD superfamily hydrolase